ncbi:MAG: DUF1816 domain-containing protein [Cyanobacteria bacterium P01_G01_bin.19]
MMNYQRLSDITSSYYRADSNNRKFEIPWWVRITTARPKCIYYFGPFDRESEAIESQSGYVEDLIAEEAQEIAVKIEQTSPNSLTTIEA